VGKHLRRITPAHERQVQCLVAMFAWCLFFLVMVVGTVFGPTSPGPLLIDLLSVIVTGGLAVLMLRLYRAGLYLGPRHVRLRTAWRTRTVLRAELDEIVIVPYRQVSGPADPRRSDAVVLRLTDGRSLPTTVRYRSADEYRCPLGPAYEREVMVPALAQLRDAARTARIARGGRG
jgi:hypothetical protein